MEIEDKSKLFVFEKKEVFLIFVFMVLITITAFTLGVRVGKGIFIKSAGITKGDIQNSIDLRSIEEESADKLGSGENFEDSLSDSEKLDDRAREDLTQLGLEEKLAEEFSKVASDNEVKDTKPLVKEKPLEKVAEEELYIDGDANAGKFTIQLSSASTRADAEKNAEPFVAANYTVVINEASVPGKGTWYRVGIGLFDTKEEAKEYILQEKSLFRGKKYLINQIK